MEPLGAKAAKARTVTAVVEKVDELTLQVAEVFGELAEMPVLSPAYKSLIGDLERAMQQYVEKADALTYRIQQDREKGLW